MHKIVPISAQVKAEINLQEIDAEQVHLIFLKNIDTSLKSNRGIMTTAPKLSTEMFLDYSIIL